MISVSQCVLLQGRKVWMKSSSGWWCIRTFATFHTKKGTIFVQGDAGKVTQEHQDVDQQIETPAGARHAVVLL